MEKSRQRKEKARTGERMANINIAKEQIKDEKI